MKKLIYFLFAAFMMVACNYNEPEVKTLNAIEVFDLNKVDYYYNYAEINIPAGVKTVYLENYSGLDEQGHKMNLSVRPFNVSPVIKSISGRDVEPFGTVKMLFKSSKQTFVAVYYIAGMEVVGDDTVISDSYVLNDFPVNKVAYGTFGETKYVQIPFEYSFHGIPEDVTIYNVEHDCTLKYTYGFAKLGNGSGYVLTDMYKVEDHVITGIKLEGVEMPWEAEDFIPDGNLSKTIAKAPAQLNDDEIILVNLSEPAPYTTEDQGQTFYHSSGVVMFEDSWPEVNQGGVYDTDFNDCVIDYDFEAKTVSDELLADEGWREQVKVVLHLRAVGSNIPYRVGVRLEGFDQSNVEYIEQYFSLDSWQNPHGTLPVFTETTIQHMSDHYETDPMNPVVEMAHIFTMNQERAGVGANAEYDYINGDFVNHTVFNLTYGFKPIDVSQYEGLEEVISTNKLKEIQKKKWYNAIPGYINVAGGLVTMTVIYHMKPRVNMSPEDREAAKANMIETVTNTHKQNFYIIKGDWTPVGLKGYDPVFIHNQSVSKYNSQYSAGVESGLLSSTIPYYGTNGSVWGFKCPTLTRHIWNKLYFSSAYPHYEEWVNSNGAVHSEWYKEDINKIYIVCPW